MLQPGERVSGGQQITHCRCLVLGGGNSPAFQSARARSFVAEVHLDPSGLARSVGGNRKPGHNQNKLIIKSSFSLYEFPDHIAAVKKKRCFYFTSLRREQRNGNEQPGICWSLRKTSSDTQTDANPACCTLVNSWHEVTPPMSLHRGIFMGRRCGKQLTRPAFNAGVREGGVRSPKRK